jgi:hypothetical protein
MTGFPLMYSGQDFSSAALAVGVIQNLTGYA